MKFLFLLLGLFCYGPQLLINQETDSGIPTAEEKKLYALIMEYRKEKKLPVIPWSKSLTIVAKIHAKDIHENRPDKKNCNAHSWSNKGNWTPCCYTPDHKKATCMWNKPAELTDYKDQGYEIVCSYWEEGNDAAQMDAPKALDTWKKSKHHNDIIINKDIWKKIEWNAIGICIYQQYAVVWFGKSADPVGNLDSTP